MREVGVYLERLLPENGNLRFEQLGKIVRVNPRCQSYGYALHSEHQYERQLGRQHNGFLVAPVIAWNIFGQVPVEQFFPRERRQPALDIARRRGTVAGVDVAEVPLSLDEIALIDQRYQGIRNGSIPVRMVLHRVPDDIGDLYKTPVVLVVKRMQDSPLHRLEPVGQVGNGTLAYHVRSVLQKVVVYERLERAAFVRAERQRRSLMRFVAGSSGIFSFIRRSFVLRSVVEAELRLFTPAHALSSSTRLPMM